MWIYFILSFFGSGPVLAMTTIESGVATGIASKLQGTAQARPRKILEHTKQAIEEHNKAQKKRVNHNLNLDEPRANLQQAQKRAQKQVQKRAQKQAQKQESDRKRDTFERTQQDKKTKLEERLGYEEISQNTKPVDYKESMQIFYKKDCTAQANDCNRGPVLTNIKSVIFDYAHTRGSFAEFETSVN